jgi:hypothetical protein
MLSLKGDSLGRLAIVSVGGIITPVYNGAQFLAEAMEGVQSQMYPNIAHFV